METVRQEAIRKRLIIARREAVAVHENNIGTDSKRMRSAMPEYLTAAKKS